MTQFAELTKMIDTHVDVRLESLVVRCVITNVKTAYGRVDFEIQPVKGSGRQWVSEARVQKVDKQ